MTEQTILHWITQYGYGGIFVLLIFGIIGLPVPDEWLLVLSGYLVFKDLLDFVPTVTVAVLGSITGLTVSYLLGRTSGVYIIERLGRWVRIKGDRIARTQHWFQKTGRWALVLGPFIPGARNLLGYIAGASRLHARVFAQFAYIGALMSSLTFVVFGYMIGRHGSWAYSTFGISGFAAAAVIVAGVRLTAWKQSR